MLRQFQNTVTNLIHQHLRAGKSRLLAVMSINNNPSFLVFNVETRDGWMMRYLLAHDPCAIVPGTKELFTQDWIKRFLFPFALGYPAGERSVE